MYFLSLPNNYACGGVLIRLPATWEKIYVFMFLYSSYLKFNSNRRKTCPPYRCKFYTLYIEWQNKSDKQETETPKRFIFLNKMFQLTPITFNWFLMLFRMSKYFQRSLDSIGLSKIEYRINWFFKVSLLVIFIFKLLTIHKSCKANKSITKLSTRKKRIIRQ